MARGNKQQPIADEQEEMTVIVLRFKGSGDSLSKGFDAVAHALAAIRPVPLNGRALPSKIKQQVAEEDLDDQDIESEDLDEESVSDVEPRSVKRVNDTPRKRSTPKFDTSLDLDQGDSLKTYCTAKNPGSDNEKYLVAAAWLTEQGGRPKFKANDMFTCFRGMSWGEQKDFTQPMRQLKAKKSYFESLGKGEWELTGLGLNAAKAINNPVN